MDTNLGLYYLGATIVDLRVLSRVQTYSDKICGSVGVDRTIETERHITIIPPFYTNYETASKINAGCAASTLVSKHPLTTARFSIAGMEVMSFNGKDVVHFPVRIEGDTGERGEFIRYVQALRQRLSTLGLTHKGVVPEEYNPHITVLVRENLGGDTRIKQILGESHGDTSLSFTSGYPTLYAQYEGEEWMTLSHDPSKVYE